MEKLKNVGTGPVSAQKEVMDDCLEFSKGNKPKTHEMHNLHTNFNGITLIALIITIIVMLILVGVTISVALNGGLFETANKAATGTQKEAERERLTEIALANYNVAEGKITDANDLASKIQSSLGLKKSDKTTDSNLVIEGKNTIWQIDLNTAEVSEYESLKTYSFTLNQLGPYNSGTDNVLIFDLKKFEEVIGLDGIINNANYCNSESRMIALETEDKRFIDPTWNVKNENTEFLIYGQIIKDESHEMSLEGYEWDYVIGIGVVDKDEKDRILETTEKAVEFVNKYGDVKFTLSKVQ